MPEPASGSSDIDRNLLFGVLALQADLLTNDQFAEACAAWAARKHTPLADLLVERGWLTLEDRRQIEAFFERKLGRHGGNLRKTLGAVADASIRDVIRSVDDPQVRQSLSSLPPAAGYVLVQAIDQTRDVPAQRRSRYVLTRLHGEGGLGRVWVARDHDLNREVALKEMRPERTGHPEAWQRFLKEAQVTGQLEHPNIVPVYELARRPEDDQPFYCMRLVRGQTLTAAIADYHQRLLEGAREPMATHRLLEAFVSVCQAIGYAHSRGVIHRDLKPDNVVLGGFGEVVVLDWGLAKLVDQPGESEAPAVELGADSSAAQTLAGKQIGTPAYMAPEQAEGRTDLIDARTDIYGLGAILFEILTGEPPHQGKDTAGVMRQIVAGPSPRARAIHTAVPAALEAICAKAMAKERPRRYATAQELALDIERYLADEPVTAYPEPWLPRLARWGRRHRPLVAGAAALLLTAVIALAVGIVAVNSERKRTEAALAAESQARQRTRAALDEMSSEVIEDWLSRRAQLQPGQRAYLEKALAHYEAFAEESGQTEEVRKSVAASHLRVAKIRYKLGQHKEAESAYRRAQEIYATLAADFPAVPQYRQEVAECCHNLGILLFDTGRAKEAEAAYREGLATDSSDGPPDYRRELAAIDNDLGYLLFATARPKEAEAAYRDALAIQNQLITQFPSAPEYREELAESHHNLGLLLLDRGRPKEAEAAYREVLAITRRLAADFPTVPDHRQRLAVTQNDLGLLLSVTGRPKEAEATYRDALAVQQRLAADFPTVPQYRQDVAGSRHNLGLLFFNTGRPKEAEAAYGEALAIFKQLNADFPTVLDYRQGLARSQAKLGLLLAATGRPKEAEAAYDEALTILKQLTTDFPTVPDYQGERADTLDGLADVSRGRKDFPRARRLLEQARSCLQPVLDANPQNLYYREVFHKNRLLLGATLLDLGDHGAAAEAAADLARLAFDPANDSYKAACLLSGCIPLAEKDVKLPEARRKELVGTYGDQAMESLRQALAKGYKDATHLKLDPDLEPLRSRDDFKKLPK